MTKKISHNFKILTPLICKLDHHQLSQKALIFCSNLEKNALILSYFQFCSLLANFFGSLPLQKTNEYTKWKGISKTMLRTAASGEVVNQFLEIRAFFELALIQGWVISETGILRVKFRPK